MNEKFKVLLKRLQGLKIIQSSMGWQENIPEDIWEEIEKIYEEVDYNLNIDTRRWYELSTTVVKIYGNYLGIRHITNTFGSSVDLLDINHQMLFFQMKEVPTITYAVKE